MVELWVSAPELRKNVGFAIMGGVIVGIGIMILINAQALGSLYYAFGAIAVLFVGIVLARFGVQGIRDLWEVKVMSPDGKLKQPLVPTKSKETIVAEKLV